MTDTDDTRHLSLLMSRVQGGDQQAYRDLFAAIGPLIIRVIRQRIRDENTAEDLYQTVLMTLHRARHTYDADRPFKPWMYSIVRNSVFDYLRKNKKRMQCELPLVENRQSSAAQDTTAEEMQMLEGALSRLPENQREAVQMLKIDGLSLEEAAKKAGIRVGAMKVRAHRGYDALKKMIIRETTGE
ncbi:MAG: sigma-70 family RNA polymerase sigma factor [Deltaproteobacteria bacterium]|nr:sigma-70 family RNA polymerase sigma factor [Deltaproteobacteria bacterium]